MIATLDQITGGRVIVGLGSGWFAQEFGGYGIDFPPVQDRLAQLDEGIQLMRRMWSEPQVTFAGRYFHTDDVYCEPKPARRPPILIGGGGEKVLLKLVAQARRHLEQPGGQPRAAGAQGRGAAPPLRARYSAIPPRCASRSRPWW